MSCTLFETQRIFFFIRLCREFEELANFEEMCFYLGLRYRYHRIIIEFWWDVRSHVDPNILNLDPDPGLYYHFWKKKLNQCIFKNFNNKMTPRKNQNFLLIWVSELWIYIWNITSFAFILSYIYPYQFLTFYWWVKILFLTRFFFQICFNERFH